MAHVLHKRVLFITERLLVDAARVAEAVGAEVLDTVDGEAAADEGEALGVPVLPVPAAAQRSNAGQNLVKY